IPDDEEALGRTPEEAIGSVNRHTRSEKLPCQQDPCLYLRESAIDEQFSSSDVAAVLRRKEHDRVGDVVRCSRPAEGNDAGGPFQALLRSSPGFRSSLSPGVSVNPGLTTFTRI